MGREQPLSLVIEQATEVAIRARERLEFIEAGQEFLFASMAHQLKSPLSVARGYSELLRDRIDGMDLEEVKAKLLKIQTSVDTISDIIDRGLGFMRLDSGGWLDDIGIINNFNLSIKKICTDLQTYYPALTFSLDETSILGITADEGALGIIIHHLVDNANKYGTLHEAIKVNVDHDSFNAMVSVANHCCDRQRLDEKEIFHPFFDHHSDVEDDHGAGIGLYTTAMLARAMLGRISLYQNDALTLTKFTLTLPYNSITTVI